MVAAADATDALERTTMLLRALVARGFRFAHPRDVNGDLVAVHGVRAHHNIIDVIELRAEHDARAMRMPGNEDDIWQPSTMLWQASGPAHTVLTRLLALPDDEPAIGGCWGPTALSSSGVDVRPACPGGRGGRGSSP